MTAPQDMQPRKICSVCGMREHNQLELYLVEFTEGNAIEIPEKHLQAVKEE